MLTTRELRGRSLPVIVGLLLSGACLYAQDEVVVNGGFEEYEVDATLGWEMPTTGSWSIENDPALEAKVIVDEAKAHTGSACLQVSALDTMKKQISYKLPSNIVQPGNILRVSVWASNSDMMSGLIPAFFYWDNAGNYWDGIAGWAGFTPFGTWEEAAKEYSVLADTTWVSNPTVCKILLDIPGGSTVCIDDLSVTVEEGGISIREPLTILAPQRTTKGLTRTFDLRGALVPSYAVERGTATNALIETNTLEQGAVLRVLR